MAIFIIKKKVLTEYILALVHFVEGNMLITRKKEQWNQKYILQMQQIISTIDYPEKYKCTNNNKQQRTIRSPNTLILYWHECEGGKYVSPAHNCHTCIISKIFRNCIITGEKEERLYIITGKKRQLNYMFIVQRQHSDRFIMLNRIRITGKQFRHKTVDLRFFFIFFFVIHILNLICYARWRETKCSYELSDGYKAWIRHHK